MKIIDAEKSDAPLIADVIVDAIGEEIALGLARGNAPESVKTLFMRLASRDDSQYSYLNALKCVDDDGTPMGFVVAYDGGKLRQLRLPLFEEMQKVLGYSFPTDMADETQPGEFYVDSLAVFPAYRRRGVARALIEAVEKRRACGLPLGLLCDKTNGNARKLYESMGFTKVGETPFAGELMDHMQRQ